MGRREQVGEGHGKVGEGHGRMKARGEATGTARRMDRSRRANGCAPVRCPTRCHTFQQEAGWRWPQTCPARLPAPCRHPVAPCTRMARESNRRPHPAAPPCSIPSPRRSVGRGTLRARWARARRRRGAPCSLAPSTLAGRRAVAGRARRTRPLVDRRRRAYRRTSSCRRLNRGTACRLRRRYLPRGTKGSGVRRACHVAPREVE